MREATPLREGYETQARALRRGAMWLGRLRAGLAEFELELLRAQLESARRQADFLQEQATERELELAEWRRLNIDLRKDRKALTEARREALE
jgi:hypothetical protein